MSGRDFGRDRRGGFGDRDRRGGFDDRDRGNGGFRDRDRAPGGFRERDRPGRDAGPGPRPWEERDAGAGSRPWERRDDERPARPAGNRPFDRPDRAAADGDVGVERSYQESPRPTRETRDERGGRERAGAPPARPEPAAGRAGTGERPRREEFDLPPFVAPMSAPFRPSWAGGPLWSPLHLSDSWYEEERLRGWTPSDHDLQEMVEDNIEADPLLNARDRRNIQIRAAGNTVTLAGTVRSRLAKYAAGSDAFWTYGAQEVRNDLTIRTRGPQAATPGASQSAVPSPPPTPATGTGSAGAQPRDAPSPAAATDALVADMAAAAQGTTPDSGSATGEPATGTKRGGRRKAAVGPPVVTEAEPVGFDQAGALPPRKSPAPKDPGQGKIAPPDESTETGVQIVASDAPAGPVEGTE